MLRRRLRNPPDRELEIAGEEQRTITRLRLERLMRPMSPEPGRITTHVLDTARGRPAAGVPVTLERAAGRGWEPVGGGTTDGDGRARELLPPGTPLAAGAWRLTFDTAAYLGPDGFWPQVAVIFTVRDPGGHHHVPLLLSPYGYSTYRGS